MDMAIARTLSALLIALSVALLPVASAAVPVPAEMSMSDGGDHDCCPNAAQPCDMSKDGCLLMAACAVAAVFSVPSTQDFVVPSLAADMLALPLGEVPPSHTSGPPLHPPQI
jgi:hypothetical protein